MDYRAVRGWKAVATLYHAYITGFVLTVATRGGAREAEDLWFAVFRRQHLDLFLPGLTKLGLDGLPDAVKAAQYHYLSNRVAGVKVEYMYESDRKAWVRFVPPRWVYDGEAICGVPGSVSRALLRGWYGHNGIALGNPRLGFVCTAQTKDGQHGLAGIACNVDAFAGLARSHPRRRHILGRYCLAKRLLALVDNEVILAVAKDCSSRAQAIVSALHHADA